MVCYIRRVLKVVWVLLMQTGLGTSMITVEQQFHGKAESRLVWLCPVKAEYIALAAATQEAIWLRRLLRADQVLFMKIHRASV